MTLFSFITILIGIFCALVAYVLHISIELMKKLVRRMERLNTLIQMQAVALSAMAVILLIVFNLQMNFDHDNATSIITDQIPAKFHQRYFLLGLLLLAISIISFLASYYELKVLFTIN